MNSITLSIEKILELRCEAFATVRYHSGKVIEVASAIEQVDAALQTNIAVRGIHEQQALIAAAQKLSSLLETGGTL